MKKLLLTLIISLSIYTFICAQDTRGYKLRVGDRAPNIELITPDGKKMMLSDLKGRVVMLQFTATWCRVCLQEMPHIETDIWNKLKNNKDFALYGIMYKQGADDVKNMRRLTSITYPLALDPDGRIFHRFAEQGAGVTRNVIINQEGDIAFLTRLFNEEEFNAMIKKIHLLINIEPNKL